MEKVDILAIGVHPDDIELGCSGTIIKHIRKGDKVAILDLTEGELGSRGTVSTRYEEAAKASDIMGVEVRKNLQFKDGFFKNDESHQLKLIEMIRYFQPKIILANALHDRHPDHGRASDLIEDAAFLSGLRKIRTQFNGIEQAAWRPARILHYIQDRYIKPDIIVDISEVMETKIESIKAYGTQFFSKPNEDEPITYISRSGFLDQIVGRAREMGHSIGAEYGEGFNCKAFIGIKDLDSIFLSDFS